MRTVAAFLRTCQGALAGLAGLPARHFTELMDDLDEVWLIDAFQDQPDGLEPAR